MVLSAVGAWPPHDGQTGIGLPRFEARSACGRKLTLGMASPTSRRDIPGSPDGGRSAEKTSNQSSHRSCGHAATSRWIGIKVLSGLPHDMEHHCELARQPYGGALEAKTLLERQEPRSAARWPSAPGSRMRLRPRKAARATVRLPAARYAHRVVHFARLEPPGREPGPGPHVARVLGVAKATGMATT